MPKADPRPLLINGLRVDRKTTTLGVARIMPPNSALTHYSGASFEYRVKLGAVLEYFPGAVESGRHEEPVAGTEFPALPTPVLERHATSRHAAELGFGIADAPLAARTRPDAGVELMRGIAEIVGDLLARIAADEAVCCRGRRLG